MVVSRIFKIQHIFNPEMKYPTHKLTGWAEVPTASQHILSHGHVKHIDMSFSKFGRVFEDMLVAN